MRKISDAPVRTFTIGFPIKRFNEAPAAENVAHHLGCQHTTRIIELKHARDILPAVQRSFGEPFADPSAIPTWSVSQIAQEQIKVVLSGDGGDELFMGYKRYRTEQRIGRMPAFARHFAQTISHLPSTPIKALNPALPVVGRPAALTIQAA